MCCSPRIAAKTTIHNTQKHGVKLSDLILRFLGIVVTLLVCFSACVNQSSYRRTSITVKDHPLNAIDLQSAIVAVKRWQKDMTASHRNHSLQCTYSRAVFIPMRTQPPHHSHILKMSPSPHPSNLSHTTSEASLPTAVEQ